MPMNVSGAITPAIEHTSRLLFKPFVLKKWLALGLVSILAQMGAGSGNANFPSDDSGAFSDFGRNAGLWIAENLALIVIAGVLLLSIALLLSWLSSVFKFVYLNQITSEPLAIKEPFHRLTGLGTSFFLWQLAFSIIVVTVLGVLVGLPIAAVIMMKLDTAATVVIVVWCILVGLAGVIAAAVTDVFARDFVLTTMYVRNVGVLEAWRTVIPILKANAGQSALYIGMLIVVGIIVGIGSALAAMIALIAFLIPGGVLALIGWGIYALSDNHWSAAMTAYTVVVGIPLLLAFAYAVSCVTQPFVVFRRTYALVVLGQADSTLAALPLPPAGGPQPTPEPGA